MPPLPASSAGRPAAAFRVVICLVVLGLLDLAQEVASIVAAFRSFGQGGRIHLNLPIGCLVMWFGAWLVWTDKRVVWPILAYFAAAALGVLAAGGLSLGLFVPLKLLRAFMATEPYWFGFSAIYLGLSAACIVQVWREARLVEWPHGSSMPRIRWLQPGAFAAYSGVLTAAVIALIMVLLYGSWTKPALERARQRMGDGYDYRLVSYNFQSVNGHTSYHAVVLAYTESQLDSIQLNWED